MVTVLLAVFNGEDYLHESVQSILGQTYKDFVLLVVNDASTDNTGDMIRSFGDTRIRMVTLEKNVGHVAALNKGLDLIETPLIARMDADDISHPRRLEKQVRFMSTHPEIGICGTFAEAFEGSKTILWKFPVDPPDIKVKLMFECALVHSSVMIRRDLLLKHHLAYNESFKHSYDWELWQRCALCMKLANIPEFLVRYRIHDKSESIRTAELRDDAARRLDDAALKPLGLDQHPLRHVHRAVATDTFSAGHREEKFLGQTDEWFRALKEANGDADIYDNTAMARFLKRRLFVVINSNGQHRKLILKLFWRERLFLNVSMIWTLKFLIKLILPVSCIVKWRGGG